MDVRRREFLVVAFALASSTKVHAQRVAAPNVVPISEGLITSGQPTAEGLANLGKLGFQAVVYLAPSSVSDAVKEEPDLLRAQGIEFVHIPIPFGAPTEAHFEALSSALTQLQGRKVLVHCQVNMRASTLVFLHRVIHNKEDPTLAWEAVTRVWSPEGAWKQLVVAQLSKHRVAFQPF